MKSALKVTLLAAAIALCSLGPAFAFQGQAPSSVPVGGVPTNGQSLSNAPNAHAIEKGGIQANQLAAGQGALDKLMWAAIDSSNVHEVKQLLQDGISLKQDYGYACNALADTDDFQTDPMAEDQFYRIQSPRAAMYSGELPGHCAKQHLLHAYLVASKYWGGTFAGPGGRYFPSVATQLDRQALLKAQNPANPAEVGSLGQRLDDLAKKQKASFEILALLDANIPVADKAFYPAMMDEKPIGTRSALIDLWMLHQYDQALPEIQRARALHEPSHMAWDAFRMKVDKGMVPTDVTPFEAGLFDPASMPGGDNSVTIKGYAATVLNYLEGSNASFLGEENAAVCRLEAQAQRDKGENTSSSNPGAFYLIQEAELAKLDGKNLSANAKMLTLDGLSQRPFSEFEEKFQKEIVDKVDAQHARIGTLGPILANAERLYIDRYWVATLLSRKDVIEALNNKTTVPGGEPPLFSIIQVGGNLGSSPELVRAMLNAGVNPGLLGPDGKTAADIAIGNADAYHQWFSQAFLKKDYSDAGCPPSQ